MEVTIGSYKVRIEIAILIIIVFWVLAGHLLCSCCKVRSDIFTRVFTTLKEGMTDGINAKKVVVVTDKKKQNDENAPEASTSTDTASSTESTPETTTTEGFVSGNNAATEPSFAKNNDPGWIMKPSEWAMPTLTYAQGEKPDAGVEAIWKRPAQKLPLPEGELDLFAKMEFKPECCPNAYSASTGCACMSVNTYDYLTHRGGNNVPYSEY